MAYELLFHDIDTNNLKASKHQPSSSLFASTKWDTQTCKMGWPVNGIWDPDMNGSDINAVDIDQKQTLVTSGDDRGNVCLFRYPVGDYNERKTFHAHSSHVMNVRFNYDRTFVFSAGGNDKCVIQWKVQ
jgi:WD40 repeat protein